uniref:F-box domain-containing protein n=1 Tax=Leersia perrieri TaxID=77586 RepID=A0A0D9WVD6_9ORYZ
MERAAVKREKLSAAALAGDEDHLGALPDDILIEILLILGTRASARTSVLSRRWRRLWCLLPAFEFGPEAGSHIIRAALAAHEATSLRRLSVFPEDSGPGPMAEWLPVAARRLSGDLLLFNLRPDLEGNEEIREGGIGDEFLDLPCFATAISLTLNLGFLTLAVPPSGVFARLTDLVLRDVRFCCPCELSDAISSPRFPSLKKLTVEDAHGLSNFTIHSDSLIKIVLKKVKGLRLLDVVAPSLRVLIVFSCFADVSVGSQFVANISAPKLDSLQWINAFDPSTVRFGKMENLRWLGTSYFYVYGQGDLMNNNNPLRLLQHFQFDAIPTLSLALAYLPVIIDHEYLMEDMTVLPDIVFLNLTVLANGHCIGPSLFHVLRMCTSVRKLKLVLHIPDEQQAAWQLEANWAVVLKEMTINFYHSISESTANDLCKKLLSFSRPEIRMKFYLGYGEPAAKREKPYSAAAAIAGGEDRLSALPDDILIQILLRVVTVDAARTSVLSRRWRRLWCLLPEFEFGPKAGGHIIRAALAPHEYLSLLQLVVNAEDSSPGPMAEWLPVAARRLSGDLFLSNFRSEDNDEDLGFVELPCFGSATSLSLDLDFLALTKPASGVFTRLTDLYLCNVRFHGPCWLGDAVSSPRSPSLKKLTIQKCQGLSNFIIHSESLLQLDLDDLRVLRCLNVVAPALKMLNVFSCFDGEPTANISAPTLEILVWTDTFDPSSVQFSKMENLKQLDITYFDVFGQQADSMDNHNCLRLLQRFQFDAIPSLSLMLFYPSDLTNHEYLMEDMTVLPDIVYLNLSVAPYGHVIGPSLFHVLRMCTGVRRLKLVLDISGHLELAAAKRRRRNLAAGGGEDRLSALPDDILIQILLRVVTVDAARTSVLSRRWRRLWCLLPELCFPHTASAASIRAALAAAADESASLRGLVVLSMGAGPGPIAEWLPVAARRLSGHLLLFNRQPERDSEEEEEEDDEDFLDLPCFGSAISLSIDLGFLALAVPPSAGVFARLTDLALRNVRFCGPCELGDAISSPWFPSLKKLNINKAQGLSNFVIQSESLLEMELKSLKGLQQLSVETPALKRLIVHSCFGEASARRPVSMISAPMMEILQWADAFDPSFVRFGKMENLQQLATSHFCVFGQEDSTHNQDCLRLLQHFQFDAFPSLFLTLAYQPDIMDHEYLMEDMTVLPDIVFLRLAVLANGHCIGPSLFHVLRMCTSVRRLKLVLDVSYELEEVAVCGSDCFCDLPPNWISEEFVLNFLQEMKISQLRGTEHEMAFVKRLLSWAASLKEMTIKFYHSITESTAKELCKQLLSISRPEIRMKFYFYRGVHKVLYVPED